MKIVLIGASVRPLVGSCISAGYAPVAFDLFADWDSRQMIEQCGLAGAGITKVERFEDLFQREVSPEAEAAIVCGGADLVPGLVAHVSQSLKVLGPDESSLAKIWNPLHWLAFLGSRGFNTPSSKQKLEKPCAGEWLVKRAGQCGGKGIAKVGRGESASGNLANEAKLSRSSGGQAYFQRMIAGRSLSAQFISQIGSHETQLLGCCEQLFDNEAPFVYAGSLFPARLQKVSECQIREIGVVLARQYGLVGFWGVDFIVDEAGDVWPVDLNARITASAELLEQFVKAQTNAKSVIDLQRLSCLGGELIFTGQNLSDAIYGKLTLFNRSGRTVKIGKCAFDWIAAQVVDAVGNLGSATATLADVPQVDEEIEPSRPILTVKAVGKSRDELIERLRKEANTVLQVLDLREAES